MEKEGAALRRNSQMNNFRSVLKDCDMSDLGFIGPQYTWCNNRSDGNFTKERLD
jgi:hypothetical protein